jgi:hypothetical protein
VGLDNPLGMKWAQYPNVQLEIGSAWIKEFRDQSAIVHVQSCLSSYISPSIYSR